MEMTLNLDTRNKNNIILKDDKIVYNKPKSIPESQKSIYDLYKEKFKDKKKK